MSDSESMIRGATLGARKGGVKMGVSTSFDELQAVVDADVAVVKFARERRDAFKSALDSASDVISVWGSGSLRRSTQLQPVHDVDLVVEFDPKFYPDWGEDGASSSDAIERCRELVTGLLGVTAGTHERLVRQVNTANRNRAAKCFIDDPDDPDAFTVDVMPALRQPDGILIPFKSEGRWTLADPEYLISRVAERQAAWNRFRPTVRVLKYWARQQPFKVKSLVMEVLALESLPNSGNRATALSGFFAAASRHSLSVVDPAGLSGAIQPSLDSAALRRALEDAALSSASALRAAADGNQAEATRLWRSVLGPAFPVVAAAGGAAAGPRQVKDSPQG